MKEGQTLGVVGQNGAGKSTLLKVLSGVMLPDEGLIEVDGKITGLLELGTGFDQELTGIENIFMNGTFLGMDKSEIEKKKKTRLLISQSLGILFMTRSKHTHRVCL